VVEYVDGRRPPPFELELEWNCGRYHCLPYSGGMMNQPIRLIHRMRIAQNAFDAWIAWKARKIGEEKKFAEEHPVWFSIVERYLEVGKFQRD
jgi:hypothetical protein